MNTVSTRCPVVTAAVADVGGTGFDGVPDIPDPPLADPLDHGALDGADPLENSSVSLPSRSLS